MDEQLKETPELTDEWFAKAKMHIGGKPRWTAEQLAAAMKKFAGKEEKPIDQSPDRGSSWMGR